MNDWHLSKNVTLSLILAIGVQFTYFVGFISDLEAKTINHDVQLKKHDLRLEKLESSAQSQEVTLARIEEHLRHLRETVDRVLKQEL